MGLILRLIKYKEVEGEQFQPIYVDFEKASPTEDELELYNQVQPFIDSIDGIINSISQYGGATELIRKSISNPHRKSIIEETWQQLTPLIKSIEEYFDCSQELFRLFPMLVKAICDGNNTLNGLLKHPAILRSTAYVIEFATKFDEYKMQNPSIQNDLSYYRRATNNSADNSQAEIIMPKDKANKIALFLAGPTPMMTILLSCLGKSFNTTGSVPSSNDVTKTLATFVKICRYMLENSELNSKFEKPETTEFVIRVMAGSIILYDHIDVNGGAFYRDSPVDARSCILAIKNEKKLDSAAILNFLRYNSKHFNDDSTPSSVKNLLAC